MENKELTTRQGDIVASVVLNGDISKLSPQDKVNYYNMFCESLGLNPVTKPFQIISFQGKQVLYATKDATEQLRKINRVSIVDMTTTIQNDIMVVKVKVSDKDGRTDISTGAVSIKGLSGDNMANAIMKAETKAKRRATLSISGLGILDESEIETIPGDKKHVSIEPTPAQKIEQSFTPAPEKPMFDDSAVSGEVKDAEIVHDDFISAVKAAETITAVNALIKDHPDEHKKYLSEVSAKIQSLRKKAS